MAEGGGYQLPDELHYDRQHHLWVRPEGKLWRVGLDAIGQAAAGEVKHVQLKPPGSTVLRGKLLGSMEAGKFVGALRSPAGGTVVQVNPRVLEQPGLVNTDPYGEGWLSVLDPTDPQDLEALVHGPEAVAAFLAEELERYRREGFLK